MNRIVVIGSGGSGKSTLARRLGQVLDLKVYHLDTLFWRPGWTGTSKEEQREVQQRIVEQEKWIIDGNYGGTLDIRFNRADTIIFLNISRYICMLRVLKRRLQYAKTSRPDMAEGCEEKLSIDFLKWVWKYPKDKRPMILDKLNILSGEKQVIILNSTKNVKNFINQVEMEKRNGNKKLSILR
ncbi:DNA topology modulation protein [Ornithinibacillus sp. BX22]|uniref:DNA topology modulation protein n=1 Tax=Ornithinibacillus hominis TaxID=2763055 RepID=A0A923RJA7_9BACI|nr:DNA topology modulation protein [Ornithinibacillus hominis]